MPRPSHATTPPDKAQGVTNERPLFVRHTEQSRADLKALRDLWGLSDAEIVRRALSLAVAAESFARTP